jgi:N-acetylglucosaminyl-diphospho-decaprenol L-rhamnosyltransferase
MRLAPVVGNVSLTVIIVSYNTRTLTLAALRTLHATTRTTAFRTVVLDNASTDGSADAIAAEFPGVEVIRSDENLGFARANNIVAAATSTEWLLLLNPDTECHEGAVDNLMAFAFAHPEAGIYGGRTVFADGSLNIASCWRRITPWSAFCHAIGLTAVFPRTALFDTEAMGGWRRDTTREVDIVVGCFLLIRRDLWNRLGGFDLRYFMYGEEADLCLRARRLGCRPMITPAAEIMHLAGAASASKVGARILVTKARVTLIRDHWPRWQVPLGVGLMWLWGATRITASGLFALTGRRKDKDRFSYWAEIWQRRAEWLRGYG